MLVGRREKQKNNKANKKKSYQNRTLIFIKKHNRLTLLFEQYEKNVQNTFQVTRQLLYLMAQAVFLVK